MRQTPAVYLEVNHGIVNAIKTNSRSIRSQVRPHNGAYVNCKLTTEWHQDRENGSLCSVNVLPANKLSLQELS